jgi:hypothetical protein
VALTSDDMFGFDGMFGFNVKSKRLWRPLLGVLVAFAVAAQGLLIALSGFALPAHVNTGPSTFELCLHDGQDGSELPANPDPQGSCTNCIFCLAGSHSAVIGAPPALCYRAFFQGVEVPSVKVTERLPHLLACAIANPRGPPFGA